MASADVALNSVLCGFFLLGGYCDAILVGRMSALSTHEFRFVARVSQIGRASLPLQPPDAQAMHTSLLPCSHTQLVERVGAVIKMLPYQQLRRINLSYDGKAIVLHGEVTSFYLKQVAQSVVLRVDGVSRIVNNVQVVDD